MSLQHIRTLFSFFLLTLALAACSDTGKTYPPPENKPYQYTMPAVENDGWQVGHLADVGIDEVVITQLIDGMKSEHFPGIDSLSIVRHGQLVLHEDIRTELSIYDNWVGNSDLERHVMHSTSKSFISTLVGIAIDQGFISGTDTPFYPYFDYANVANWDMNKDAITLEDVLTMQLGLEWDEWRYPFGDTRNSLTKLTENNDDFVKALLDLPLTSQPGTFYAYNTVASIALGKAVENKTAQPLEDFAEQYLFEPLQIERADWLMTPTGFPNTGSGLFLATRDMAKLGQLYLNKGEWNGLQIVSRDWIDQSLHKSVELNWDYTSGYGYQWWLGEFSLNGSQIPFYSSRGYGGQFIVVVPDFDLVIAVTAHNYENDLYDSPFRLIEQLILPAIYN